MILPSKHLSQERALLTVGSLILAHLESPRSVSELWEKLREHRSRQDESLAISFDWFTLALTFLFTIQAIELRSDGLISVLPSNARGKS
jgi:hypothetical protein